MIGTKVKWVEICDGQILVHTEHSALSDRTSLRSYIDTFGLKHCQDLYKLTCGQKLPLTAVVQNLLRSFGAKEKVVADYVRKNIGVPEELFQISLQTYAQKIDKISRRKEKKKSKVNTPNLYQSLCE